MLIDYLPEDASPVQEDTVLITGSHNISETAEKKQFDNMIRFRTPLFKNLYKKFYDDFYMTFMLGRDENDEIKKSVIDFFLTPKETYGYRIHNASSEEHLVSLSKSEMNELRAELLDRAPNMLSRELPRKVLEKCDTFNPETGTYYSYSSYSRSYRVCKEHVSFLESQK